MLYLVSKQMTLVDGKFVNDGIILRTGFKYYKAIERCYKKFN